MFIVIHLADGVDRVTSLVLFLLGDERLEVREKAAQVHFHSNFSCQNLTLIFLFCSSGARRFTSL